MKAAEPSHPCKFRVYPPADATRGPIHRGARTKYLSCRIEPFVLTYVERTEFLTRSERTLAAFACGFSTTPPSRNDHANRFLPWLRC